jgi:ribosome recycling factor
LSEDLAKDSEKEIQDLTDEFTASIERILARKEKDIMSV